MWLQRLFLGIDFRFSRAKGATHEALFAAYCRLLPPDKSLSYCRETRLLERAMGIEPTSEACGASSARVALTAGTVRLKTWRDKAQALDVLGPVEVGGALWATVGFA